MSAARDLVATGARLAPGKRATIDLETGRTFNYAVLDRAVDACAALLALHVSGKPGSRLAMLSRNSTLMLVVNYACVRLGWIFVPLNWRLSEQELGALIVDFDPVLLVAQPGFADVADALARTARLPVLDTATLERGMAACPPAPIYPDPDPQAISTLLYTSGTSGKPKGVMLCEEQAYFGLTNFILANRVGHDSVLLCDMPMFHVAGLYSASRSALAAGGTVAISEGFDAARTLARLGDPALGITHYFCVVQMAQILRAQPGFATTDLTRLVALCTGGAPNPKAHIEQWLDDGVAMIDGFGMSETGTTTGMPVGDLALIRRKAGSVGVPLHSVEARIVDEQERALGDDMPGELWVRGPNVARGYWNRPEETAAAFAPGGWFRTGDIARRDADGFYYLVDRKKDMFISGGENVYSAEVEAMLRDLPGIADVAVVGVPDARWGEVGCAYIVAEDGVTLDPAAIVAESRARAAHYKVPRHVRLIDAIPRNAAGKAMKPMLRTRFAEEDSA